MKYKIYDSLKLRISIYFFFGQKCHRECFNLHYFVLHLLLLQGYKASDERKTEQESVDTAVLAAIGKEPQLRKYMGQLFSLRKGQFPHEMVF